MRKLFKDYINTSYNLYSYREDIEWANFWIDKANQKVTKRILLIGDSTARMIRSTLSKFLNVPVDLFASSSALDDVLFVNQIDDFFCTNTYNYDLIFVQIGHHSRMAKDGSVYTDEDYDTFMHSYESLLLFLKQYSDMVIAEPVFLSYLPLPPFYKLLYLLHVPYKENKDDKVNYIKERKNMLIKQAAQKQNVILFDIVSFAENSNLYHSDHIHYHKRSVKLIAKEMAKYITSFSEK